MAAKEAKKKPVGVKHEVSLKLRALHKGGQYSSSVEWLKVSQDSGRVLFEAECGDIIKVERKDLEKALSLLGATVKVEGT